MLESNNTSEEISFFKSTGRLCCEMPWDTTTAAAVWKWEAHTKWFYHLLQRRSERVNKSDEIITFIRFNSTRLWATKNLQSRLIIIMLSYLQNSTRIAAGAFRKLREIDLKKMKQLRIAILTRRPFLLWWVVRIVWRLFRPLLFLARPFHLSEKQFPLHRPPGDERNTVYAAICERIDRKQVNLNGCYSFYQIRKSIQGLRSASKWNFENYLLGAQSNFLRYMSIISITLINEKTIK